MYPTDRYLVGWVSIQWSGHWFSKLADSILRELLEKLEDGLTESERLFIKREIRDAIKANEPKRA